MTENERRVYMFYKLFCELTRLVESLKSMSEYSEELDHPVCPNCGDPNVCTKGYAMFCQALRKAKKEE